MDRRNHTNSSSWCWALECRRHGAAPRLLMVPDTSFEQQLIRDRRGVVEQLVGEWEEVSVVQRFVRRGRIRVQPRDPLLVVVIHADLVLLGDLPGDAGCLLL